MKVHPDMFSKRLGLVNVPKTVPDELLNGEQAMYNHGQPLATLDRRGGMGIVEILMNIHKSDHFRTELQKDVDELNEVINNHTK